MVYFSKACKDDIINNWLVLFSSKYVTVTLKLKKCNLFDNGINYWDLFIDAGILKGTNYADGAIQNIQHSAIWLC